MIELDQHWRKENPRVPIRLIKRMGKTCVYLTSAAAILIFFEEPSSSAAIHLHHPKDIPIRILEVGQPAPGIAVFGTHSTPAPPFALAMDASRFSTSTVITIAFGDAIGPGTGPGRGRRPPLMPGWLSGPVLIVQYSPVGNLLKDQPNKPE